MAREFMASHGIDLDALMSKIQFGEQPDEHQHGGAVQQISRIINARLPCKPATSRWDISIAQGLIKSIEPHQSMGLSISRLPGVLDVQGGLVTPGLCHAHVHLDKCFILQDEKFSDLEMVTGDFSEAMKVTGEAKARFEESDLLRRGRRLINESIQSGVVSMRAFVEVDEVVELKCVKAGLLLKKEFEQLCHVQICAFAQLALFSDGATGLQRRQLMEEALTMEGVDVIGSTPYVESDETRMKENIEWTIKHAISSQKLLDFHLDYNLDPDTTPMVWQVLAQLEAQNWRENAVLPQTVCLGHCTRLTLFESKEWYELAERAKHLPLTLVGLPMSDLFMMARPGPESPRRHERQRGTLQILEVIQNHGLEAAIAMNNIGNAFTPQGSCDPLAIATMAVGIYHAATKRDAQTLFEAISCRASNAIGRSNASLDLQEGIPADLTIFPESLYMSPSYSIPARSTEEATADSVGESQRPYSIGDLVWLGCRGSRRGMLAGRISA